VRPADSTMHFATPAALAANPTAYDLESLLTHEMGHTFGVGHSDVWRAIMFPFVPPAGTFLGSRPTSGSPNAPLADDDRGAVRALYPDPSDTVYVGSIAGRILPANALDLSGTGATGIFAAHVVAINAATGTVAAAAISGWSCSDPGPPVFDGSYRIAHLPVGAGLTYQVYAEPLDGPVAPSDVFESSTLCRNALTDPGWPAQFACITPAPVTNFSTKIRSGP
jgi:Matrixin